MGVDASYFVIAYLAISYGADEIHSSYNDLWLMTFVQSNNMLQVGPLS